MSVTHIPKDIKNLLVFRAGGRCEFEGCNKDLSVDALTKIAFNDKQFAHIIADSPDGPRGCAESALYAKDIDNLMLMCPDHHKLIDDHEELYTVEVLNAMKKKHEDRVKKLLSLAPNKERTVIFYRARIGTHAASISKEVAREALWPDWYPSSDEPIELGFTNSSFEERDLRYWNIELLNLENQVKDKVLRLIESNKISKMALFALAPMPLLVRLGTLLPEIYDVLVFQKHRNPNTWNWQKEYVPEEFELRKPEQTNGEPCLVFSVSANIRERVEKQFANASIWEVSVPNPGLDYLQTFQQLSAFRQVTRDAIREINANLDKPYVNVFMAVPNSCAVEIGRVWMQKADKQLRLFDYYRNESTEEGRYTFTIAN